MASVKEHIRNRQELTARIEKILRGRSNCGFCVDCDCGWNETDIEGAADDLVRAIENGELQK